MRGFAKGVMNAHRNADQIDIHWTINERDETLKRAYADLERARLSREEIAECAGFIEGLKQTAVHLGGHNWNPAYHGGWCQTCED